jgi:rubrerythrin
MEKYGYEEDHDLTKKATEAGKCPQCSSPLEGNPPVCPKCGSEPFEKKKEKEAQKK